MIKRSTLKKQNLKKKYKKVNRTVTVTSVMMFLQGIL